MFGGFAGRIVIILFATSALLTACSVVVEEAGPRPTDSSPSAAEINAAAERAAKTELESAAELAETTESDPVSMPMMTSGPVPAPTVEEVTTNPRIEMEEIVNYPRLIPFDGIRPVYDPKFITAAESTLVDDELVIGVAFGDEAKAYSITVLRTREMVNDELAGRPILVTW